MNLEFYELDPPDGAVQALDFVGGPGDRPYPNIPRLAHREYGNRVGIFRILDAFAKWDIRPTIAIDAMTAERYPKLVKYCRDQGAHFVAHGISVSQLISNRMSEEEERNYIDSSMTRIESALRLLPKGWSSPEASESIRTPALLGAAGMRFVLDWSNDEQPYKMTVPAGELFALPTHLELDDVFALARRQVALDGYVTMARDTIHKLVQDGKRSGRSLVWNLHPWLIGQPFRLSAFNEILRAIREHPDVWAATADEIVDAYARDSC